MLKLIPAAGSHHSLAPFWIFLLPRSPWVSPYPAASRTPLTSALLALPCTFAAPCPPSAISPWVSSVPSNSRVSSPPCSSSGTGLSRLWVSLSPGSSPPSCTHTSPCRVSGLLIQPPSLLLPCFPPGIPSPLQSPSLPFPSHSLGSPCPMHPPGSPFSLQPAGSPFSLAVSKPPLSLASPRSALQPLRILSPPNPPASSYSPASSGMHPLSSEFRPRLANPCSWPAPHLRRSEGLHGAAVPFPPLPAVARTPRGPHSPRSGAGCAGTGAALPGRPPEPPYMRPLRFDMRSDVSSD